MINPKSVKYLIIDNEDVYRIWCEQLPLMKMGITVPGNEKMFILCHK